MIAVETNILVYSHRRDSPWHAGARECVASLAEGPSSWMIPWPCIHEFLGIATHPGIYRPASTIDEAASQVEAWMNCPSLVIAGESVHHWSTLRAIAERGAITGPRFHDARIAAICMDHGVRELWSADRDFSRFAGLRVVNPLVRK
jgi:toxin-antitoxin system PIN domain toxin